MTEYDWMKDIDCLQGFAEFYESLWLDWIETYKQTIIDDEVDRSIDMEILDEE